MLVKSVLLHNYTMLFACSMLLTYHSYRLDPDREYSFVEGLFFFFSIFNNFSLGNFEKMTRVEVYP